MLVWQNIKLKRVKMSGNDSRLLFPLFIIEDDKEKNILLKIKLFTRKNVQWVLAQKGVFYIYKNFL